MKTSNNPTASSLKEELKGALKAFDIAKARKAKADEEFELAATTVAALLKQLCKIDIGEEEEETNATTNSYGVEVAIQTIGGFAVGDSVRRAKRDAARGKVVGLYPTGRVRVQFNDRMSPGNYLPENLRKI